MADQLASTEDLATWLQESLDRATAELVIQAATAVVQAITGQRLLEVVDDVHATAGPLASTLRLPERPVTAVSAVAIDGVALAVGTTSGAYRLTSQGLWRDLGWASTDGPTHVTVTYTHGWPLGSQQLELARSAVLSLAKTAISNPSGAVSEKIDDYAVAYEKSASAMEASPFLRSALRRQYGPRAGLVSIF